MDRLQGVATGLGIGCSALLLGLGVGLLCDASSRDARAREWAEREHRQALARSADREREDLGERAEALARLRERLRAEENHLSAARRAALAAVAAEEQAELDARWRERQEVAVSGREVSSDEEVAALLERATRPRDAVLTTVAEVDGTDGDLLPVREAALTGDLATLRTAIAQHNERGGGAPIFLNGDPELARRGVEVRARYDNRHGTFGIVLEARAGASLAEPVTVLVAPGSIVKAVSGYQDTAPIQARFLRLTPRGHAEAPATICCAQIHSNDPSATTPSGIDRHADPRVARVAAAAERLGAAWGPAQVAIWAVANDATYREVASAPGGYLAYVDEARSVLEGAGIDTNALPLYKSSPRGRRSAFGEVGARLRSFGG